MDVTSCEARTEGSRETEVGKLEVMRHAVDKQILRLQVAVQDSAGKRRAVAASAPRQHQRLAYAPARTGASGRKQLLAASGA